MNARLLRTADTEFGCFGYLVLYDDAGHRLGVWRTMEDDWLDNAPNVSSIPAGSYRCRLRWSDKHQCRVYEIEVVPGRDNIEIHWGNTEEDVLGCVCPGTRYGAIERPDEDTPGHPVVQKWDVADSKTAFDQWMKATAGRASFPISVEWAPIGTWRSLIAA